MSFSALTEYYFQKNNPGVTVYVVGVSVVPWVGASLFTAEREGGTSHSTVDQFLLWYFGRDTLLLPL